jgi:hypothetical protein
MGKTSLKSAFKGGGTGHGQIRIFPGKIRIFPGKIYFFFKKVKKKAAVIGKQNDLTHR